MKSGVEKGVKNLDISPLKAMQKGGKLQVTFCPHKFPTYRRPFSRPYFMTVASMK